MLRILESLGYGAALDGCRLRGPLQDSRRLLTIVSGMRGRHELRVERNRDPETQEWAKSEHCRTYRITETLKKFHLATPETR